MRKHTGPNQHNFQTLNGAQNNLDIKPTTHTTKKKPVPKSDRLHHNQEKHISQAQDARSFNGIETFTDHKLVKASFKIKLYKVKFNKPKIERLPEENIAKAYTKRKTMNCSINTQKKMKHHKIDG